ncbi:hypothetical protein Q760_05550 [Cellulomonas cellasea DSM 20118]|uniref:Uncharacterized protein n=1 Tax=Cellulomonas cellasea DSM 20118 TaxID=1408250 RepID=A0A0A0B3W3_9CELL|nr:hypothetical protein Q760_05550 [Cellulomonas cellasea DSM 20118]
MVAAPDARPAAPRHTVWWHAAASPSGSAPSAEAGRVTTAA